MSRYKKIMLITGIMQKEILTNIQKIDPRIDKPLLSKIVNDICLPTKSTLESICKTLRCDVLDIYDQQEIDLLPNKIDLTVADVKVNAQHNNKNVSNKSNIYNLTVEIDRNTAQRVFSKSALKKLGFSNKTDFVRYAVNELVKKLDEIEQKEKNRYWYSNKIKST